MEIMEVFKEKAKRNVRTIVFPEGENPSIQQAAIRLAKDNLINPILIANKELNKGNFDKDYGTIEGIEKINPNQDSRLSSYIEKYCEMREMPYAVGEKIITQPIYFAAMMVKERDAHGMVAGINYPTEEVIMASELIFGLQKATSVSSSFYLLDIPGYKGEEDSLLVFADPAINPSPTSRELADIAYTTACSVKKLLNWIPRVALLSFSTKGSASHPCLDKVKEAVNILHQKECDFIYDGELQADAAINKVIGLKKTKGESPVAGKANVLIFPDLNACNISSKLVQQLAGAKFFGPILQGFNFPVSDLSRGATVEDIIGTALLTSAGC